MKYAEIVTIIKLHLKGESVRSIEKKTGRAKSTIEDAINNWRSGQVEYIQEAIPYEDTMMEIASYMKKNNLHIGTFAESFLNHSVLGALSIDMEDLIHLHESLKNQPPEIIPSLVSTLTTLKEQGLDYPSLSSEVNSLQERRNEVQSQLSQLTDAVETKGKDIIRMNADAEAARNDLLQTKNDILAEKKDLERLRREHKKMKDSIDKAESVSRLALNLGVELDKLEQFMKKAFRLGYDADVIQSLQDFAAYGLRRGMETKEINEFRIALESLQEMGWNSGNISKLSLSVANLNEEPDQIAETVQIHFINKNFLIGYKDILEKECSMVKDEISRTSKELEAKKQELTDLEANQSKIKVVTEELTNLVSSSKFKLRSLKDLDSGIENLQK